MKSKILIMVVVGCGVAILWWSLAGSQPKYPVALLRVVDQAGKGVAGAMISPEGMRTKPGPYAGGWYGWKTGQAAPQNAPVTTDKNGYAYVPYPKYVFERIETGTLCLAVNHPNFVPDRPECVVSTSLPAGAPLAELARDLWGRLQHKALITHADPIVLKQGASLRLTARPGSGAPAGTPIFAQVSMNVNPAGTNFWSSPGPGQIEMRRLAEGTQTVRAIQIDAKDSVWFSDVFSITAVAGKTNELAVDLTPGVTVRGELDAAAVRPIKNGRAIAEVWPHGQNPSTSPPNWHDWAPVREDGSFEIHSLPAGDLEILAICNGYVSTNGPGRIGMRYPQKHVLGSNDISIVIGMEPTAWLRVMVTDDKGNPLKDATVSTWPNARYGDWFSTGLGSDCYCTADSMVAKPGKPVNWLLHEMSGFNGISDSSGVTVLSNLPADVTVFAVNHAKYVLPAVSNSPFGKRREVSVTLRAGITNQAYSQLELKGAAPIAHY